MSKGLFSRTCTWITMADCHISLIAKSSLPPGNFVLQVDGLDASADTFLIGGHLGSIHCR